MNNRMRLNLALMQIENIANLLKGNPYEGFTTSHLLPLKYEIERQLALQKHVETMGKSNRGEST